MVYNNSKKAAQGVGTLIIFIAMILVAAVAAGVLISTVSDLQGRAEITGSQIQERLSTGFTVIQVGVNGTSDGVIAAGNDTFELRAQLAPGSDAIRLDDVTMSLVTQEGSFSYIFDENTTSSTTFTADSVRGNVSNGYVNSRDVVTLSLDSAVDIGEGEEFEVTLFPGAGDAQRIMLVTPPSLVNTYTVLR